MTKSKILQQLVSELCGALPAHIGALKNDFKTKSKHILENAFHQFDLVTRKEFETQSKVLTKTRQKLEQLQTQLSELESLLKQKRKK